MTDGVLASCEGVYAQMGGLGWSVQETDAMEVWQIVRFLGDASFDPVIRGSRGLRAPSDPDSGGGSRHQRRGPNTHGRFDPNRATPRSSDPGLIHYGLDAK